MPRQLAKIFDSQKNVAALLEDTELSEISQNAIRGYDGDDQSRSEWKGRNKEGMKLAMQCGEQDKTFPFPGAANVMYPLISIASIQFASRAYPNMIPGWDIVKGKVIGNDESGQKATRASRVATHMNYQINEEMPEWESETDKLLSIIPIVGCAFKETYFSPNLGRNVSVYHSPEDIVMNYKAQSIETVPRITKKYLLYRNEIIERQRAEVFLPFEIINAEKTKEEDDNYINDVYKPHLFYEQHTWLDLDGDGYAEPYILNIHADSGKVVRIVPRFKISGIKYNSKDQVQKITARNHFTKFSFLNALDGSIYDLGFGSLLGPINHTVNTTIDQLLDAGTINNCQGGFIGRNISLGRGQTGGPLEIGINEWIPVNYAGDDLRKNIVPLKEFMKEPSGVLFSLLGFMTQAGEKLSSVTELLMGEQTVHNEPATTSLARIEQGLKVFSSIHKRLHKSFSTEFKMLFDLNAEYMNPQYYYRIVDVPEQQQVAQDDYDREDCDIIPTSSPEDVSNSQKMVKAQMLYGMKGQGFNDKEIDRRFIEAMQIPNPEAVLEAPEPPPDPKIVLETEKLDIERKKLEFEMAKYPVEMAKMQSEIIKNLAQAESEELGPQLEQYKQEMQLLMKQVDVKARPDASNQGSV